MIRTIKALFLAGLAVLAMSAVFAGGAQAAQFTCGSYPCVGTGEQTNLHVFKVQGSRVECHKAHFEGELAAASETAKVKAKYSECTAFGFATASVNMNSCYYDFTAGVPKGSVHVKCTTPGDSITVSAPASGPLCIVHIPEQTPTGDTIDFANLAPTGTGISVDSTVTGIHSNVTDIGGFFCPLSSNSTDTSGTYTGKVDFKPLGGNSGHIS